MIYIILIMIIVYALLYYHKLNKLKSSEAFYASLLYFYVCLVLLLTVIPKSIAIDQNYRNIKLFEYPYGNLKPFNGLQLNHKGAVKDIVLNILMMIPFSFLYSKVKSKTNFFKVVLVTFMFSFFIESFQLVTSVFLIYQRSFDVTDIITNTFGGTLGYILYRLLNKPNKS